MMSKIYVETSVISYLTARPSRDVVALARQEITHDWWQSHIGKADIWISTLVKAELQVGDSVAAERRLSSVTGLPCIETSPMAQEIAAHLIKRKCLPAKSIADALHIGLAVSGQARYLLTWNFKHLANPDMRARVEEVVREMGYKPVLICTPEEF